MNPQTPTGNASTHGGTGDNKRQRTADALTNDGGVGPSVCCPCVNCDHCECHELDRALMDATYLDSLPVGYRFKPTDEELVTHYLLRKIKNENLPRNKINEAYIYGDYHPKDIVVNYLQAKEGEWYFFTSRNRKYVNGKRPCRKAGSGYWKATGADKDIIRDGAKIGGKKSLVYHEGRPPKGTKTEWMMHEYVVEGYERPRSDLHDMKLDDYVLCKIYTKKEGVKAINEAAVSDQQAREENLGTEPRDQVTVPDRQARVVSTQDINPTSFQVKNYNAVMVPDQQARCPTSFQGVNNVFAQSYQNMGTLYGPITPYSRSIQPVVQRTGFPKLTAPLQCDYSLTPFTNNYSLPSSSYFLPTPRKSAPCPPNIVNYPLEYGHMEMLFGPGSNLPSLANLEGNDIECDPDNYLCNNIESIFSQDGNEGVRDDNYQLPVDGNGLLDLDESKKQNGQY